MTVARLEERSAGEPTIPAEVGGSDRITTGRPMVVVFVHSFTSLPVPCHLTDISPRYDGAISVRGTNGKGTRMYRRYGKRLLDLVIVIPALIILAPVMAIIALLVRIKLGPGVIFRQLRPGLHGRPFTMLKFRTMTDARDPQGRLLPDEQRLTPFGRFLRSTSLDELPELFCVLRGDMSLVGPRPLLMQYLARYTPEQRRRHEVLPGITGLAQINGRNAISWEEKFAYDVQYVDQLSFWLDLKILALTLWKVIKREGICQPGHATAEEFRGSSIPSSQPVSPSLPGSD